MMNMRYYYNGELKTSKRVNTPGKSSDLNIGKGLCYFGNTRHNAQSYNGQLYNPSITLNADVGYFMVYNVPR